LGSGADEYVSADCRPWTDGNEISEVRSGDEDVSVDVGVSPYSNFGADGAMSANNGPFRGSEIVAEGRRRVKDSDSAQTGIKTFSDH